MDTYQNSLTAVPAPLIIIQGISKDIRPKLPIRRIRTLKEQKFKSSNKRHNYGVQISIDRELDDLNNQCIERLIGLINKCNVRDRIWWPNQEINNSTTTTTTTSAANATTNIDNKNSLKLKQRMLSTLNNGNNNLKGLWFNIKYVEKNYEIFINGSKSPLSPYNKDGEFFGSLLPIEWIEKYYDYIPSVFISIYEINNDKIFDDLIINEINRLKLKFSNTMIKFVCILIDNNKIQISNNRLQNLLTKINMNSNSLFIINGLNDEISKREQNIFIRKLMIGLKQYTNDFFNLQIQKLKKREIKDDQYSEIFFNCRNLIKISIFEQFKNINDYSIKLLEYSYDKLLKSLKSIDVINQFNQYNEIKIWLDIMCIHIVRSYIVLNDSNIAYRKFTFHINQIKELDKLNLKFNWISNQFTWLSELIENINYDQLHNDNNNNHDNNSNNINNNFVNVPVETILMPTLGIKEFKFNSYNMPNNGFNYLQAFEFRKLSIKFENFKIDNSILLLNGALDSFNLTKICKFSRIESRIYLLLGDIYYLKKNYSMAVNNYFASLSIYKQENFKLIVCNILEKILNCYIGLSQIRESWGIYIELCFIDDYIWEKFGILNEIQILLNKLKEKIISLELINDDNNKDDNKILDLNNTSFIKEKIFNIDINIKKYSNMINDGINIQILISHKGNKMISNLIIKSLEIEIGENFEFKLVKIINKIDDKIENNKPIVIYPIECISKEIKEEVYCPLEFKSIDNNKDIKYLILQLHIKSNIIGKFYIPRVKINGIVNDIEFNTINNISNIEDNTKPFIKWYEEKSNKFETIINHFPSNSFEILPNIPNIKCKLNYDKIGFNGRKFFILIEFLNDDLNCLIKINIKGICEFLKKNKFEIICKWGLNFKDFEYIGNDILKPGESIKIKCLIELPQINGLPLNIINKEMSDNNNNTNCNIKFNIQYELINDGIKINIKKEAKIKIFEMFEWETKLRVDKNGEFPNLFKIDKDKMLNINNNFNIPIHSRKWIFKLNLKNISFDNISITSCKFIINGPKGVLLKLNPEINNDEINKILKNNENKEFKVLLDIICYENIIKSIPIELNCLMEYYIDEMKDNLQNYKLEMYKANLPHVDPRLLVLINKEEEEENENEYIIEYIIENPTDRIFQYQTNLNTVNGIEIIDYVKNMQLSIMPFMRENFKFKYKFLISDDNSINNNNEDIMLPEFTLYDRQFKVFVKPNIADDQLKFLDGQLYLKR